MWTHCSVSSAPTVIVTSYHETYLHSNTDKSLPLQTLYRYLFFLIKKLECFHLFSIWFFLSENSLKIISTQLPEKMANAQTLQWKYKPHLALPKNSVPRLHKVQHRNRHYGNERSQCLHVCHWKTRTGQILDWKTNKPQKMSGNISDSVFAELFIFSYAENISIQNTFKSYEQTGLNHAHHITLHPTSTSHQHTANLIHQHTWSGVGLTCHTAVSPLLFTATSYHVHHTTLSPTTHYPHPSRHLVSVTTNVVLWRGLGSDWHVILLDTLLVRVLLLLPYFEPITSHCFIYMNTWVPYHMMSLKQSTLATTEIFSAAVL